MPVTKANFNEPFILVLRNGTVEDPYVDITETISLVSDITYDSAEYNIAILRELPLQTQGVSVLIDGETELTEIRDSLTQPDVTSFKVDYTNGRVYFSDDYSDCEATFTYKGRGAILVHGERIALSYGNTLDSIYTLANYVQENIGELHVGDLSQLLTEAKDKVVNAVNEVYTKIEDHENNTSNPHEVTKAQVGLSNVDNTSDANKPVSTAQQAALNALEGSIDGDIGDLTTLETNAKDSIVSSINEIHSDIDGHIEDTDNPHSVTQSQVGLGNVDNTSDANKPVSSAQQGALEDLETDLKEYSDLEDENLQEQISALAGAYIYIGKILLDTTNVTQEALDSRAEELRETSVLQTGWVLIDNENNEWYFDGLEWLNLEQYNIYQATNDIYGIVKGNENVSVSSGLMTVLSSEDSDKLGGELPSFYAEKTDLDDYVLNAESSSNNFNTSFDDEHIWRTITTPYTNKPSDIAQDSGKIPVYMPYEGSTNTGIQVIFGTVGADDGKIWMRRCDSGTWSDWKLVSGGGGGSDFFVFSVDSFATLVSVLENEDYGTKYIYTDNSNWDGIENTEINVKGKNYIFGNISINNLMGAATFDFVGDFSSIYCMNKVQWSGTLNLTDNATIYVNDFAPDSSDITTDSASYLYYDTLVLPDSFGTVTGNVAQESWFIDPFITTEKVFQTLDKAIISADKSITEIISLTKDEYDALEPEDKVGKVFLTTDEEEPGITVEDTLDSVQTNNSLSANMGRVLNEKKVDKEDMLELIAHRGFANVNVENTLEAMQFALTQGADSLEFDVQASSDGTIYLFHDTTVDANTDGTGTFTELEDTVIDGLSITLADDTPLEGIGIPKLVDVLSEVKHRNFVTLYPEIKQYNNQETDITTMVNIIKNAGLSKKTMWQSFNFSDLTIVNGLDSECEVGFLVSSGSQADLEGYIDNISSNLERGSLLAGYTLLLAYPSLIGYAEDRGVGIGTWTVNVKQDMLDLLDIGVYKIMSNYNIQEVK